MGSIDLVVDAPARRVTPGETSQPKTDVPMATFGLRYRADIDGLRAVAVALVVLYHAGVPWFSGGYVGVDVFFVISGFLITTGLVSQAESGGVRLLGFYAGRIRRLFPLSLLTLAVTGVVGVWLLPVARANELLGDARSALLYVSNWRFADKSVAYVDTQVSDGLLTHFWSLSIEEQYYFAWPLLVAGAALVAQRRRKVQARHLVAVLAVAVVAVSLALSIMLTPREGARAYYHTLLRLWEIAAGAIVAVAGWVRWRTSTRTDAVRCIAIVAILVVATSYGATTPFPGVAAVAPVAATALLIGFGGRDRTFDRVLGSLPFRYVGERSYALYLWHWPALGATDLLADRAGWSLPHWIQVCVAIGVAFGLTVASHALVENPVRHSPRLKPLTGPTLAVGATATLLLVALVPSVRAWNVESAARVWAAAPVTPNEASKDTVSALYRRCHQTMAKEFRRIRWCELGDPAADVTIALVGDSHAQHWAPAFDAAGQANRWRVLLTTRSSCVPYDVPIYAGRVERMDDGCRDWGEAVRTSLLGKEHVDLLVLGRARAYVAAVRDEDGGELDLETARARMTVAVGDFAVEIGEFADRLLILQDTPVSGRSIPDCLDTAGPARASECDFPVALTALEVELLDAERAGLDASPGDHESIRSLNDVVCPGGVCRALLDDGTITFRDGSHMTASYSRTLAGQVAEVVRDELAG